MLACDIDPGNDLRPGLNEYWGGSTIDADCDLSRLLGLWLTIRVRCPAVCIQNTDCRLYTPDQFRNFNTDTDNAYSWHSHEARHGSSQMEGVWAVLGYAYVPRQ